MPNLTLPMPALEPAVAPPLALPAACVESASSSRFYVESDSVPSDYSLRGKHHDTEYTSSDYWLNGRYLHSEDYAVAMELDAPTPLDLRVHRS